MSRDLPADLEEAIEQPVVRPFIALSIDLPDPVFAWGGTGNLTFEDADGVEREWVGAGQVGALDAVGESTDGSATGIKATLHHVPSEFRDDIADQATKNARFELYAGAVDTTFANVEATKLIWKGRLDTYDIIDAGQTLSVEVTGESRGIDQKRPAIKRFTDEYQQRQHSGDLFFQYVAKMTEVAILWAQAEQKGTVVAAGGGGGGGGGFFGRMVRS